MANQNAVTGLSPVGTSTGATFNEQGRLYAIGNDSSNTYAIGDIVKSTVGCDATGIPLITKAAATDTPLGVIVGIRPANPGVSLAGTNINLAQLWVPLSNGNYSYAYVVDDPSVVFEVQANTAVTTTTAVGSTAVPAITANQTSTLAQSSPFSATYITSFDATPTSTSMFQVVGVNQSPDNTLGAYNKVLVQWNKHQFFGGF